MAFKMKGSPMHRNFGIGSPAKQYKQPVGPRAEIKSEKLRKVPMTNKEMSKDDSIKTRMSEGSIETQALRRKENKKQVSKAKSKAMDLLNKPIPGKKSPAKQGTTSDGSEIKSKRQISQDSKTSRTSNRQNDVTEERKILGVKAGTRKYTKAERASDKMKNLDAKEKRASGLESIGKGEKGFSWKEAGKSILRGEGLMGNIASGMGKGRDKSAIIKDKKRAIKGKAERSKIKKEGKAARIKVKTDSKISDEI